MPRATNAMLQNPPLASAGPRSNKSGYAESNDRERFGSLFLNIYDRLAGAEKALHTSNIVVRIALYPFILLLYVVMMFVMFGIILHVPTAQVFAHFERMDPNRGYTVSFSEYQHRQRIAQGIIITSVVVTIVIFYYLFVIPAMGLYMMQ